MDIEVVIIISVLVAGLGYCVGSVLSPVTRHLKSHIRFLEGKVNRYKQDHKESKTDSWLDQALDEYPILKPFKSKIEEVIADPSKIQNLLNLKKAAEGKDGPGDSTTWR